MVYVVGLFVAVVARGVALQNDGPVAFVFWVAVFFRHCYRAASGLLSVCYRYVSCRARLGWVCLLCVMSKRNAKQSDDALPIWLPQSDYLAPSRLIMFTGRTNA